LARAPEIPRSLTVNQAAAADNADPNRLVKKLGNFLDVGLARSLRRNTDASGR
jgi:hypothetical protein